jgi:hypothetical protein
LGVVYGLRVSDAWVRNYGFVLRSRFSFRVYHLMFFFPRSPSPLNIYPFTLRASHSGFGFRRSGLMFLLSGFVFRVSRSIFRVSCLIFTVTCFPSGYSGFRSSGLKSQVPGFGFDIPGFEGYPRKRVTPRIPSARTIFLVSDWIFRVSGVIFQTSGFSSDISGFGSDIFRFRF